MLKKLKPLLPALREKKRYLAFEVISKHKIISIKIVSETIYRSLLKFLGDLLTSKAGIIMLEDKWNQELQRGIMKVNHKYLDYVRGALTFINAINDERLIVRSIGASGILKKSQKYIDV